MGQTQLRAYQIETSTFEAKVETAVQTGAVSDDVVKKAGDTMTGTLGVPTINITSVNPADTATFFGTDDSGNSTLHIRIGNGADDKIQMESWNGAAATSLMEIGQTTVTIKGDLVVSGTTTTVNSETLEIGDNFIILNSGVTGAPVLDAGITVERGSESDAIFKWNETEDKWEADNGLIVGGNIRTAVGSGLSDADGDTYITVENSPDEDTVRIITAGVERVKVDESGNVKIYSSSNVGGLTIDRNNANFGSYIDFRKQGTRVGRMHSFDGTYFGLYYGSTPSLGLGINASDGNIYIPNKLGIGTSNPGAKLQIDTVDPYDAIRMRDTDTNDYYAWRFDSNGHLVIDFWDNSAGTHYYPFLIKNDARTDALVISGSNVGIRTVNPDTMLTLGKGINETYLKFNSERPWVFKADGSDGDTRLVLNCLSTGKFFVIQEVGTDRFKFKISDGTAYADGGWQTFSPVMPEDVEGYGWLEVAKEDAYKPHKPDTLKLQDMTEEDIQKYSKDATKIAMANTRLLDYMVKVQKENTQKINQLLEQISNLQQQINSMK